MAINSIRPGDTSISNGHLGKTAETGKQAPPGQLADSPPVTNQQGDSVRLSSSALQIQNLSEQLASNGENVDQARVAEVRQAIDHGSYSIDSRQLADKMLDFEARL